MLIKFSVKNWMSFRDQITFSMIASRERQHRDRVPALKKYQTKILPVSVLYGGNASGKTNFCKALGFAKWFVVKGTQPGNLIPLESFRLDTTKEEPVSHFSFQLFIDKNIYDFSFSVTRKRVLEEKLVEITSTKEKILYHRQKGNKSLRFHESLKEEEFLHFAFQGTRENQLFLNNSVSQKVTTFKPVYDWFKDTLELVSPDSRFGPFEKFIDEDQPLYREMNQLLPQLDTGIFRVSSEAVPFDNIPIPEVLKKKLEEEIKEGVTVRIMGIEPPLVVTRKNDKLIAKRLITFHKQSDGKETKFEIYQESDGSKRVIDLLPIFLMLSGSEQKKVYVIDELDRSLHTLLTRGLIEAYLNGCSESSRKQLLFTTHDLLLMDQSLFRRDEMWVLERDRSGNSELVSFSEYQDVRSDKNIRKSYLQGRLGGVPNILIHGAMNTSVLSKKAKRKH